MGTFPLFQSSGMWSDWHHFSNTMENGLATTSANSLRTLVLILCGLMGLCMLRFLRWSQIWSSPMMGGTASPCLGYKPWGSGCEKRDCWCQGGWSPPGGLEPVSMILLAVEVKMLNWHPHLDRAACSKHQPRGFLCWLFPYFYPNGLNPFSTCFHKQVSPVNQFFYIEGNSSTPSSLPLLSEEFIAIKCSAPVKQFVLPNLSGSN